MNSSTPYKLAIVAALEREIAALTKNWTLTQRDYAGRKFTFFESGNLVAVAGGIGLEPARRAAEAVIALYHPAHLHSVGFAGALHAEMRLGDIFSPAVVIDARDGSRTQLEAGEGTLVTFMAVAGAQQKSKLAEAYQARAVDMEAAAVAAAARAHGITFGATKVISDELSFEMPGMARFIDVEGQFKTVSFAMFAALRPWLWKPVAALAGNSSKAAQILSAHLARFCDHMANPANPDPVAHLDSMTVAAQLTNTDPRTAEGTQK
jgi:nucleoside phosphorylase